jgi:hypothetical protein
VSKRERTGRSVSSLSKRDRGRRSSDMLRCAWCVITWTRCRAEVSCRLLGEARAVRMKQCLQ